VSTDIKVVIKAIKTIRQKGILIETGSEEEMNKLTTEINTRTRRTPGNYKA